jgi:hypothetical protein
LITLEGPAERVFKRSAGPGRSSLSDSDSLPEST